MVASITRIGALSQSQQRPAEQSEQVVPKQNAGRPTEDRVDLGSAPQSHTAGFGIDLAYGRQRHQVARVAGTTKHTTDSYERTLSLDFEFVGRLASGKELDELVNAEEKAALSDAIDRIATEGLDGAAGEELVAVVDALFDEYEDDLGLDEGALDQARELLTDEVVEFFEDAEGQAGAPLLKAPGEGEIYERYSKAVDSLRDRIERGRRSVLAAAGHAQAVLAEFAKDAQEDPTESRLSGLGEFVARLQEAKDKPEAIREDARARLLERPTPLPEPFDAAVEVGRSFLAALHG